MKLALIKEEYKRFHSGGPEGPWAPKDEPPPIPKQEGTIISPPAVAPNPCWGIGFTRAERQRQQHPDDYSAPHYSKYCDRGGKVDLDALEHWRCQEERWCECKCHEVMHI